MKGPGSHEPHQVEGEGRLRHEKLLNIRYGVENIWNKVKLLHTGNGGNKLE